MRGLGRVTDAGELSAPPCRQCYHRFVQGGDPRPCLHLPCCLITFYLLLPLGLIFLFCCTFHLFFLFCGNVFPRQRRWGDFIKCNHCDERVGLLCWGCLAEPYRGVGGWCEYLECTIFFCKLFMFFLKKQTSHTDWWNFFCFAKDCKYLFICSHGQIFTPETLHIASASFLYFEDE